MFHYFFSLSPLFTGSSFWWWGVVKLRNLDLWVAFDWCRLFQVIVFESDLDVVLCHVWFGRSPDSDLPAWSSLIDWVCYLAKGLVFGPTSWFTALLCRIKTEIGIWSHISGPWLILWKPVKLNWNTIVLLLFSFILFGKSYFFESFWHEHVLKGFSSILIYSFLNLFLNFFCSDLFIKLCDFLFIFLSANFIYSSDFLFVATSHAFIFVLELFTVIVA